MTIEPDTIQSFQCGAYDVTGILCRKEQLFARYVAVIRFIDSKRRGFNKYRYVSAKLFLPSKLFGRTFGVLTDRLPQGFVSIDALPE